MNNARRAIVMMTGAMACFVTSDAVMKIISEHVPAGQALFLRGVLITAEVRLMERVLDQMRTSWQNRQTFRVNLGGLRPAIFVLRRV